MKSLRFLSHALLVLGAGMASAVSIAPAPTMQAPVSRSINITLEQTPAEPLRPAPVGPQLLIPIKTRRRSLRQIALSMGYDFDYAPRKAGKTRYNRRNHRIRRNGWA